LTKAGDNFSAAGGAGIFVSADDEIYATAVKVVFRDFIVDVDYANTIFVLDWGSGGTLVGVHD
jgi:hypothetical protein